MALARKLQEEERASQQIPKRTCEVCDDSYPISELPSLAQCDHPPKVCATCYSGWVAAQLQESSWREAKCPEAKCKTMLSYYEVQQVVAPDTFQQYDTYITRAAMNEDPNFRWCRACTSGQIHISGQGVNIFTCASCNHKVCTIHENTWHEGETCEAYNDRLSGRTARKQKAQKAQEAASLRAIRKISKKCPGKNCGYSIEKNRGCDHMTCKLQLGFGKGCTDCVSRLEMSA
ncbi:hypothetical protein GQ44DRAFT_612785 [Phaeosphaeriaceae sp. PMI808]|nr:hypothetical protein GQ44DRAFT_612785 [Phaeosphaeriaceae sp. PMI808]